MTPTHSLSRHLACIALAALATAAQGADSGRSPCSLTPASEDVISDSADGRSLVLDARKNLALVNWDVRWHQRQRIWVTVAATNRNETPATIRTEFATDLQPDGGRSSGLAAPPLAIPPHASVTQRMALYLHDDAKTAAVLLHAAGPGTAVAATFAVECSDRRFDAGEMTRPAAALLDEALKLYSAGLADPIPNPRLALQTVRVQASGAQDATDVAWAMRYLMASLHDDHSYIRAPGEAVPAPALVVSHPPTVELLGDGIAALRLYGVGAIAGPELLAHATRVHDQVAATGARHPRGWIVDLREHGGGDMWATLAGLGALLQGPTVGAFVGHDGRQEWIVDRGAVRTAGGKAIVDLQLAPEPSFGGPIAVLIGPNTAGAGEAVAIAFEGRPRTRFFGAPTQGRDDAAIVQHALSDGTLLGVVGSRNVDRNGVVYRGPVEPDKRVDAGDDPATLRAAVEWLQAEH